MSPPPAKRQRSGAGPNSSTIVLDLDETLVHCDMKSKRPDGIRVPIREMGRVVGTASVLKRPHVVEFLRRCCAIFDNVVIWTAASQGYADIVIDSLVQDVGCPSAMVSRMYRDHCTQTAAGLVKDLRMVTADCASVWLVDDKAENCVLQPASHVPVARWEGSPEDQALLDLIPTLDELALSRLQGTLLPTVHSSLYGNAAEMMP